ncbi:hypothetical protein GUJ93_ZPchr0003g18234 [Zizania palustris]|uniref:Uncharacterized protein n=1 Tax=Zizania palustris TaxID=103762 RepID=A0A8J5VEB3_ZIZPA|nr:hypothetical protein GUJ93_ZPchr0003g18234 [Zizania palustris]
MKGLFKSKLRTPADVVRQTRELLVFLSPTLRQAVLLLGQVSASLPSRPRCLVRTSRPVGSTEAAIQKHSNRHSNSPEAQQQSSSCCRSTTANKKTGHPTSALACELRAVDGSI